MNIHTPFIPSVYVPPWGGPLYWGDEVSGILIAAVRAFFGYTIKEVEVFTPEQFALVRGYCNYYIHAPCWDGNPYADDETRARLRALREKIRDVKTAEELDIWIGQCLEEGIDPL